MSMNQNEGKTFMAANLGHAMSAVGKKVLLIDLDYMKPELADYFPRSQLKEQFHGQAESKGVFEFRQVGENLDLISTAPLKQDISDWLDSASFRHFVESLKSRYDLILVDTPAVRNHFEAVVSSRYSDFLIVVVNQRWTLREDVVKSTEDIRQVYQGEIYSVLNFAYDEIGHF